MAAPAAATAGHIVPAVVDTQSPVILNDSPESQLFSPDSQPFPDMPGAVDVENQLVPANVKPLAKDMLKPGSEISLAPPAVRVTAPATLPGQKPDRLQCVFRCTTTLYWECDMKNCGTL